jgi:uncharacterized protein
VKQLSYFSKAVAKVLLFSETTKFFSHFFLFSIIFLLFHTFLREKMYLCTHLYINNMNGIYTILLLVLSNIFMTLAWYGHLKLQQTGVSSHWPLIGVIAFSWTIAFFEYCCQVPANRIGFIDNGGPFNLVQLKVIQECISLIVFAIIANILFQGQGLHWNHAAAFLCLIAAVYFVFMK